MVHRRIPALADGGNLGTIRVHAHYLVQSASGECCLRRFPLQRLRPCHRQLLSKLMLWDRILPVPALHAVLLKIVTKPRPLCARHDLSQHVLHKDVSAEAPTLDEEDVGETIDHTLARRDKACTTNLGMQEDASPNVEAAPLKPFQDDDGVVCDVGQRKTRGFFDHIALAEAQHAKHYDFRAARRATLQSTNRLDSHLQNFVVEVVVLAEAKVRVLPAASENADLDPVGDQLCGG
mmetsp:Transcript_992/g.3491  ORF Transcript_992/g.3491 Transcript_992/m.3491 type:complete len:235 (-) Transcript_992:492-1196(-)